jgi:O-antigen/teichoic acid export membrane protein
MASLGRKSFVVLISRVLAAVLALVGLIFTTRYLGPEINGQVSWALALVTTFNSISDFGFAAAHIKRISEGKDIDDCVSTYTSLKLLLTVGMVIGTSAYVLIWRALDPSAMTDNDLDVITLIILYCVFYNVSSIFWVTYEGRMEAVKSQLVALAEPASRTPLMIFVAVGGYGSIDLAFTYVVGGIAMSVIGIILIRRENIHWKRPTMFRNYWVYALPISLITVFGTVSWNLDKLVIEAFGTPTDVAFFSQPQTLLGVLGFVGIAVTTLTFPAFSRLHAEGDFETIRTITHQAERYISMIALPVAIVIVLFPTETVVTFFGPAYLPAAEPMRILAIGTYISLLSSAYTPQIGGINRPDISAKLVGFALVLNAVLLLILVPSELGGVQMLGLGVVGASIANALVALVFLIIVRDIVYRLTHTKSNPRILLHLLAGGLSAVVLYLLTFIYPVNQWYDLFIYGLIELPVFFGFMALFKELTKFDIQYFKDIVHPGQMWDYISGEMKRK